MGRLHSFLQDLLLLLTLQPRACASVSHTPSNKLPHSIFVHGCTFPKMYLAMDMLFPEHKLEVISPVLVQPTIKIILRTQLLTTGFKHLPCWFWRLFLYAQNKSIISNLLFSLYCCELAITIAVCFSSVTEPGL